jgi:hypothetical protein
VTRVYAFTLVCDVYQAYGCHNTFARARAGMLPDALVEPEQEAAAAGWQTVTDDAGRMVDLCPACAGQRRYPTGDTAWSTAESPVPTRR